MSLWSAERKVSSPAWIHSAGTWSLPANLYLLNYTIATSASKGLSSGTEFQMPNSKISLVITIRPKAEYVRQASCLRYVAALPSARNRLNKRWIFFEDLTYIIRPQLPSLNVIANSTVLACAMLYLPTADQKCTKSEQHLTAHRRNEISWKSMKSSKVERGNTYIYTHFMVTS